MVKHYTRRRRHACLGPGIPEPSPIALSPPAIAFPTDGHVIATPVLNELHHEYQLAREDRFDAETVACIILRTTRRSDHHVSR